MRWTLLATFVFSLPVWSFPVVLKIENECNNPFRLFSKSQTSAFEIPAHETRELVVLKANDWQVGYATGVFKSLSWKLNFTINDIVNDFKAGAEKWNDDIVTVCTFALVNDAGVHRLVPKLTRITGVTSDQGLEAFKKFADRSGIIFPDGAFSFADLVEKPSHQDGVDDQLPLQMLLQSNAMGLVIPISGDTN